MIDIDDGVYMMFIRRVHHTHIYKRTYLVHVLLEIHPNILFTTGSSHPPQPWYVTTLGGPINISIVRRTH